MTLRDRLLWLGVVLLGAISFAFVALHRGESVNAAWLVVAAVCIYFIAYRFYALFITSRVLRVDAARLTPAWRRNDGLDYVPTNVSCFSATTSQRLLVLARWSDPCSQPRWATCRARCGSWPAWSSLAPCRT